MRDKYIIRPMEHLLDLSYPSLNFPPAKAEWPTKNVKIDSNRIKKRWGYSEDRDLEEEVQQIIIFQKYDRTRYTVYLTATNAAVRETGAGKTFSYITPTYTTGTISGIAGTTVTGSTTAWDTGSGNPEAGDYFIMDDDWTTDEEIDTHWETIASVTDDTHLELDNAYTINGTDYTVRKVYSVPTNERWQYAIVNDKLCFTNGNVNVQYWDGTGNAADLDATNAKKARYCIEYAERLCLADLEVSGNRSPWTFQWSKNGDPTDWTDSTAGRIDFLETEDFITGLGKVGNNIIVYKRNHIVIGSRTGDADNPFAFTDTRSGVGCVAPYSIIPAAGTNFFLGRDDFYFMNGTQAEPIGHPIRYKFFDIVSNKDVENVWGFNNVLEKELIWKASTDDGNLWFVFDYKDKEWTVYEYTDNITGAGRGVV